MSRPTLYYVRHGLTDWNIEGRLQGGHDIPLNDRGRTQAAQCAGILRDLFARDGRAAGDLHYVSSPLVRASETMDIIRSALDLPPGAYVRDPRLQEIAFGDWEGLTYLDVLKRDRSVVEKREGDKWLFRPPGGETYEEVARRVGEWYATLDRDTVVTAHGGTGRALVGHLGIAAPEDAAHHPIEQGVVYLFADQQLTRYA
ncbi:MAG: histidine phosphatase family protein [Xanthobacteraceae bacterium]|nr:histidine phosphatase family protein [Xanthobacteraceae bacterium]